MANDYGTIETYGDGTFAGVSYPDSSLEGVSHTTTSDPEAILWLLNARPDGFQKLRQDLLNHGFIAEAAPPEVGYVLTGLASSQSS